MCNFEKYFFEFNEMMIIGKGRQNGAPFQYVPWGHVSLPNAIGIPCNREYRFVSDFT